MIEVREGKQVPEPVYENCLDTPLALALTRWVPPISLPRMTPANTTPLDCDLIARLGLPHWPSFVPSSQACTCTKAFQSAPGLKLPPGPSAGQPGVESILKLTVMLGSGLP